MRMFVSLKRDATDYQKSNLCGQRCMHITPGSIKMWRRVMSMILGAVDVLNMNGGLTMAARLSFLLEMPRCVVI